MWTSLYLLLCLYQTLLIICCTYLFACRYGVGYHLTVVKGEHCQPKLVTQYIQRSFPSVKKHSDVGQELSYILPREESSRFDEFFKQFEGREVACWCVR